MTFQVIGCVAHIGGASGMFSSHMAAFEACMRIKDAEWTPIGRDTWFETKGDDTVFVTLRAKVQA